MTSLSASAARGGAITLVFQAVKFLVNMLSIIVLGRLISPEYYGLVAMVSAVIGIASIFRDFGLSTAALQARELSHAQRSNLFWINFGVGGALTLAIFLLAGPISLFYGEPALVPIVQWLSLTYLLGGASTQFRVAINRELRFFTLSLIDLMPYVLGFGVAAAMAMSGANTEALVAQQLVVAASGLLFALVCARWLPGLPAKAEMSPILKFGGSLAATQLLSYATRNVDSIALGRVWGASVLGVYDRAYQLMITPLNQINTPLSRVAIPVLSRLQDEPERYTAYLRRAQLVALYVTTSALGVLAALAPHLVPLLMGPAWGAAGLLVSVLAVGGVFRSLIQLCYWIYMSRGLAGAQLRFFLVAQPLLTASMLLGLPWGALGVAVAHSAGFAVYWAVSLMWVGRVAKIDTRPMFGDAVRSILLFATPSAVIAATVANLVTTDLLLVKVLAGLGSAILWFVIAAVLSARIRRDLLDLVGFARLAFSRGKKR